MTGRVYVRALASISSSLLGIRTSDRSRFVQPCTKARFNVDIHKQLEADAVKPLAWSG